MKTSWTKHTAGILLASLLILIVSCGPGGEGAPPDEEAHAEVDLAPVSLAPGERLKLVATTSIVADVVAHVGGDRIDLAVMIPQGADPHSYEPSPRDLAAVAEAHLLFASGLDLEEFLEGLLESAGAQDRCLYLSHEISPRSMEEGEDHEGEGQGDHQHEGADPHVWTDPNNVILWVDAIQEALISLDPDNASAYQANAEAYRAELEALDAWIREQVAGIPQENRRIVTDHSFLGYLADAYGLEQVGAIIPSYSTLAETSAGELAELEDSIRELGVRAVFVGNTVNPSLAETVAQDTGVQLIPLYTGSLSQEGGEADTYIAYMRYNVEAIASALRE